MTDAAAELLRADGFEPVESLTPELGDDPRSTEQQRETVKEIEHGIVNRDLPAHLLATLTDLQPLIHGRRGTVQKEAITEFAEVAEAKAVRLDTIPAIRDAWKTYTDDVAENRADRSVSDTGHNEFRVEAAAKRDAAETRVKDVLDGRCDTIAKAYPEQTLPTPSAEVTNEAQLVFTRFGTATGKTFFGETSAILGRASDSNTDVREQIRCNQLLQHAYLPCCQRRAESPERHSRFLQLPYEKLAGLIETHLDSVLGHARHRLAVGVVEQARGDFKWVTLATKKAGEWDDLILSTGAQAFDFGENV